MVAVTKIPMYFGGISFMKSLESSQNKIVPIGSQGG